jgi:hypothetical protein
MKITKARLKQIIKEELEAVVNEEETEDEAVEESFAGGAFSKGQSHRDRPSYQKATVGGRVAARSAGTPTLDAAAEALGMSAVDLMKALADEMLSGDDPSMPAAGEPAFPEGP